MSNACRMDRGHLCGRPAGHRNYSFLCLLVFGLAQEGRSIRAGRCRTNHGSARVASQRHTIPHRSDGAFGSREASILGDASSKLVFVGVGRHASSPAVSLFARRSDAHQAQTRRRRCGGETAEEQEEQSKLFSRLTRVCRPRSAKHELTDLDQYISIAWFVLSNSIFPIVPTAAETLGYD